ncbi:MAG: class I SAM-dependent methyltransferase [Solirubrobacterales bacterium]
MSGATATIWHDVECGGYEADLPLWEELAERHGDPVLELGCGTGRVALHLARRGHRVIGVDRDYDLILELAERAGDLPVEPTCVDALDLDLTGAADLALAPMQFLQLLRSAESRQRCLQRIAGALRPGGLLAAALVARLPRRPRESLPPLPDVREMDGWIYSSLPTAVGMVGRRLKLRRLRQIVAPDGSLTEEVDEVLLLVVNASELEAEAEAVGFAPAGRRTIPPTEDHVGSTVILLEKRP